MFTLIKEFDQAAVISSLKRNLEEDAETARFMTMAMPGRPTLQALQQWWQEHDTGWPLAICICVAEGAERPLLEQLGAPEKAYVDAFVQATTNVPDPRRPRLMPALWVQYAMHHIDIHGAHRNEVSNLHIWAGEDCALVVTNPHLLSGETHFIFDPASGLYRTKLTQELAKIEDPIEKMERLVATFAPTKSFKPYASGWGAISVLNGFMSCALKGSPFPLSIGRDAKKKDSPPIELT